MSRWRRIGAVLATAGAGSLVLGQQAAGAAEPRVEERFAHSRTTVDGARVTCDIEIGLELHVSSETARATSTILGDDPRCAAYHQVTIAHDGGQATASTTRDGYGVAAVARPYEGRPTAAVFIQWSDCEDLFEGNPECFVRRELRPK